MADESDRVRELRIKLASASKNVFLSRHEVTELSKKVQTKEALIASLQSSKEALQEEAFDLKVRCMLI